MKVRFHNNNGCVIIVDNGDGWWLVLLPDFKSACRDAERSEVCSIRTHPRHKSRFEVRGSWFEYRSSNTEYRVEAARSCLFVILVDGSIWQQDFQRLKSNMVQLVGELRRRPTKLIIRGEYMNLIDILILGFTLLGALHGYQKGLLSSLINLLSSIVGFLVASWQYMSALRWAEQYLPLQQWLEPVIYKAILPSIQSKASSLQHQALGNILGALPQEWRSLFENQSGAQMPQAIEQVAHRLAGTFTESGLSLIAFGCVFYIVVIIIQLLFSILLRPFGGWSGLLNRGGGLVVGGLSALIGMSVMAGLFSSFLQLGVGGSFNALIQSSSFYPYLVEIFRLLDQVLAAQLSQKLLEPMSQGQGVWF